MKIAKRDKRPAALMAPKRCAASKWMHKTVVALLAGVAPLPAHVALAIEPASHADSAPPLPPARPNPPPPGSSPPEPSGASGDCLAALAAEGALAKSGAMGAPADPRCSIAQPVTLEAIAPGGAQRIDLPDHPTLDCIAALTFAHYVNELLAPLARGTFDAAIVAVSTGPGFDCRTRDHIAGAKMSAHAQGLALDIAEIKLAGGLVLKVGARPEGAALAFDHAARAAACGYFHTALGPGADPFHANHWHVDLEPRGGDGKAKLCQ